MNDSDQSGFENICKEMATAFDGVLSWRWDDRFEAVLAEFSIDNKDGIQTILERCLSHVWEGSTIRKAPENVRELANDLGGLRSGQLLFTSDPATDAFIFGVWWPWGDGQTISIRVGPFDMNLSDSELDGLILLFKGWFGIVG